MAASPRTRTPIMALLVLCLWAGRAAAAAPAADAPSALSQVMVLDMDTTPQSLWDGTRRFFDAIGSALTPPTPGEFARGLHHKERSEFWMLLEDAGYQVREIETSVGIVPSLSTTFRMVRELSDADREWLERRIDLYAERDGSMMARMQRSILHVLLEASAMENYKIETVAIDFLPLPKARFTLNPSVTVLSEDLDVLYRMMASIKKKIH